MDGMGVDHCWDGMNFSVVDEFLSVGAGDERSWVKEERLVYPKEEVLEFDAMENDTRQFMDELLMKADDNLPGHWDENELLLEQTELPKEVEDFMEGEPVGNEVVKDVMDASEFGVVRDYNVEHNLSAAVEGLNNEMRLEHIDGEELPQETVVKNASQPPQPQVQLQGQGQGENKTLEAQPSGIVVSVSPVSNSPGDQSPLLSFGAMNETLEKVPKGRKTLRGKRTGRSVSEKFITKSSKTRIYANPTASHFCHICWRRAKYTPMAVCSNIQFSSCRKVICKKCFIYFKWDWEKATAQESTFQCTHCSNSCPEGAQCYTYGKTNLKRRSSRTKDTPGDEES